MSPGLRRRRGRSSCWRRLTRSFRKSMPSHVRPSGRRTTRTGREWPLRGRCDGPISERPLPWFGGATAHGANGTSVRSAIRPSSRVGTTRISLSGWLDRASGRFGTCGEGICRGCGRRIFSATRPVSSSPPNSQRKSRRRRGENLCESPPRPRDWNIFPDESARANRCRFQRFEPNRGRKQRRKGAWVAPRPGSRLTRPGP